MIKAKDVITQLINREDIPYLKIKLFDVNMRIFKNSVEYRNLINHCCDVIKNRCLAKYEDYKKPHGMSGANCAIPFNIIGYTVNRGKKDEYCEIMINPKITDTGIYKSVVKSNCGSIILNKPIDVERWDNVYITYYDINGIRHTNIKFSRENAGFTIQHEVDHNQGILITDRQV